MKRIIALGVILCSLLFLPVKAYTEGQTSAAPDPSEVQASPSFWIDNRNVYEGMDKSYSEGYIPRVADGYAAVVLPLLCDGALAGNQLRASVNLGDSETMPFVCKNYEKTVALCAPSLYLISFSLELKADRINGNYPVAVTVAAADDAANALRETFTVYVVITDGKALQNDRTQQQEEIVLTPKVLVQSYSCAALSTEEKADVILAGEKISLTVTLVNTARFESVKNMSVTAAPPEGFALLSASDTQYIGYVGAGATFDVTFTYATKSDLPAGQYGISVSYDYAFGKGMSSSGSGTARVTITQPLQLELSLVQMPEKAVISDTVSAGVQAINLSRAKAYNVRAVIKADGLSPAGTVFLGDIEGGASVEGTGQVVVTGLSDGNFPYGQTNGTVTFYYEDADGNEQTEVKNFSTEIQSPFSENESAKDDAPGQWWVIMAVIAAAVAVGGAALGIKARKGRKREKTV